MSLRDLLRSQLLDKFRKVKDKGGVYILIFDEESKDMLSNYGDIQDAMTECGASFADLLFKKRKPQPLKDALYFIQPNEKTIRQINLDFQNKEKPKYRKIHFLFTSPCTLQLNSLFNGRLIDPIVITKQEIIVNIYVGEKNVYHFNEPSNIQIFFTSSDDIEYKQYCKSVVNKLQTLFLSLGDYPIIQYSKNSIHPRNIALVLQEQLEELRLDQYSSYPSMQQLRNRPILLIIDRTYDLIAPLIHEFTYQAMTYDLLNIKNDTYKYTFINNEKEEDTKEVLLNEDDKIWQHLKHKNIRDVSEELQEGLEKFAGKYESVTKIDRKEKNSSIIEMNQAVKNVTAYNEEKQMFGLHTRIAGDCLDIFRERNLNTIGNIEQDLAIGYDPFGDRVSEKQIKSQLKSLWNIENLNEMDKLRLLCMYSLLFSTGPKDRAKLASSAGLSPSSTEILHKIMQIQPSWLPNERKKKPKKYKNDEERPYDLSRWKPKINDIIEKFLESSLSSKEYPILPDVESFKGYIPTGYRKERKRDGSKSLKCRKQPSFAEKLGQIEHKVETKLGDRYILYILGGVTYSELREVYAIASEKECDLTIIGCSMITGNEFLKAI